jgi:hypothetical protein
MPLELWLEEVIKDGATLGQVKETLGIGQHAGGQTESGETL